MSEGLCPCGNPLPRAGRKYCSKPCFYRYRVRPKGLTYTIHQVNRAWIKPGQRLSPKSGFQKGHRPHNQLPDDQVGYDALHDWVKRRLGPASDNGPCADCGGDGSEHRLEWANKSHEYKRHLNDWLVLCTPCHRRYDILHGHGAGAERFIRTPTGAYGRRK